MLIEFSGVDGSGKSTQMERFQRRANELGIECHNRMLTSTSRAILALIGADEGASAWRDLFDPSAVELATALELYQQTYAMIVPISQPGQLILIDGYARYWLASAGMNLSQASWAVEAVYRIFPAPDLAIHLRVEPAVALERIVARQKGDHVLREGGIGVLEALDRGYALADRTLSYQAVVVDGAQEPADVERDVAEAVRSVHPRLADRDRELVAELVRQH